MEIRSFIRKRLKDTDTYQKGFDKMPQCGGLFTSCPRISLILKGVTFSES